MKDWKDQFRRFMVGRYGTDELNRFLSGAVLVGIVLHLFIRSRLFFWLELTCLIVIYARTFSRNTGRRFRENQFYLQWRFHAGEGVLKLRRRLKESRRYKIFRCPGCGQRIRIPRGHGKIQIHCPSCGSDFMGKS